MDFIKSATATAGIGVLGLGAYAISFAGSLTIASPLMIPVGAAMVFAGGLSWLYQRAHRDEQST